MHIVLHEFGRGGECRIKAIAMTAGRTIANKSPLCRESHGARFGELEVSADQIDGGRLLVVQQRVVKGIALSSPAATDLLLDKGIEERTIPCGWLHDHATAGGGHLRHFPPPTFRAEVGRINSASTDCPISLRFRPSVRVIAFVRAAM